VERPGMPWKGRCYRAYRGGLTGEGLQGRAYRGLTPINTAYLTTVE